MQSDQPGLFNGLIFFRVVNRLEVIDPKLDMPTFAENSVRIPFTRLEHLRKFNFIRGDEHFIATGFIVECAPIILSEVCLIADHFMVIGNTFAAKLNAGIRVVTDKFEVEPQFEVVVFVF